MRFILLAFVSITILLSSSLRAQWVQTDIASGDQPLCMMQSGSNLYLGTVDSGVYRSTDDGSSWSWIGLRGMQIHALATMGTTLVAGTSDEIGDGAVYFSTNEGASWAKSTSGPSTAVLSLTVNGTRLYAGTATGSGIFVTTNNGASWKTETSTGGSTIWSLASIGSNVFAGADEGVYLSTNNGTTWSAIDNGLGPSSYVNSLTVIGSDLFAGTFGRGVAMTSDNGAHWVTVNRGLTDSSVLSICSIGTNVFAGTDSGVFLTTNNGNTWQSVSTGETDSDAYFVAVAGSYLYCQTYRSVSGFYRRPLSEMIPTNAVHTETQRVISISAYPNPVSRSTAISFTPESSGFADVSIVNQVGTEVAHLYSGELPSGEHAFIWEPAALPDGMYECVVHMNGIVQTESVIVEH